LITLLLLAVAAVDELRLTLLQVAVAVRAVCAAQLRQQAAVVL
jgi:hypothetical protein